MKKNEKQGRRQGKLGAGVIMISFIAAAITFVLLLKIEENMLRDYEKESVWITTVSLEKNVEITDENRALYFRQVEVDKSVLPSTRVKDVGELVGSRTIFSIPEGSVLSVNMFTDDEGYRNNLVNPVIVGCKAEDLYQVASGILRQGDVVNVYTVSDELEETYLLWDNVLVYQTFDQSGNRISSEDVTVAASRINLLMEESWTEQFYTELQKGSLRMVKIWDHS